MGAGVGVRWEWIVQVWPCKGCICILPTHFTLPSPTLSQHTSPYPLPPSPNTLHPTLSHPLQQHFTLPSPTLSQHTSPYPLPPSPTTLHPTLSHPLPTPSPYPLPPSPTTLHPTLSHPLPTHFTLPSPTLSNNTSPYPLPPSAKPLQLLRLFYFTSNYFFYVENLATYFPDLIASSVSYHSIRETLGVHVMTDSKAVASGHAVSLSPLPLPTCPTLPSSSSSFPPGPPPVPVPLPPTDILHVVHVCVHTLCPHTPEGLLQSAVQTGGSHREGVL